MASAKTGARGLALAAIKRVEKDKAYLDRLVDHYQNNSQLNEPDRRLLTELAYGAVRHQRLLDFYIEQILDRKIHQTDLTTRNLLRLGAYQLLFLNKIPARAAVNETVELSANYARPLVNAVLRKLAEKKAELKNPEQIPDRIERLAVKYSHPDWMVKRFIALFGETEAEELLAADNQRPELNLRVNTLAANRGQLLELWAKKGIQARPGKFSPFALILESRQFPAALPGYQEGWFAVQDEASQAVVMMLAPKPGELILDACSAPGTKSLMIFQLMEKAGRLVSADLSERKLRLLAKEASRLGLQGIEVLAQDLTLPLKSPEQFDKILLDAPCSGLGTLRRHPEIKWRRTPEDISQLAATQKALTKNLARLVRPGGVLVYATCTFTLEENQEVAASLVETGEFQIDDPSPYLPEPARFLVKNNILQTLPHRHGTDGFTALRLRKIK